MKQALTFLLALCGLAACRPSAPQAADAGTDTPADVVLYLDSVLRVDSTALSYAWDEARADSLVQTAISALGSYADGRRTDYPGADARAAIHLLSREEAYIVAHGGESTRDFFRCFLQQAVRLCPDPALLTDIVAEDGKAGVLYFPDWSGIYPFLSYLLVKEGDGCTLHAIGTEDSGADEIHSLRDDAGRTYYLCSYNVNSALTFAQYLFLRASGGVRPVCTYTSIGEALGWNDLVGEVYDVDFHPSSLTWTCGSADNGCGTLRLVLDGENSTFRVE